ncbi:hypothetical protein, partial [Coprococcus comes]|uniref:hypothetical protein n=1 Tax=Coprococcus comes TaxID=410072 RepID=UPI001A9A70C7
PESLVTVRIFLFGAVSLKKRYLPTAPFSHFTKIFSERNYSLSLKNFIRNIFNEIWTVLSKSSKIKMSRFD